MSNDVGCDFSAKGKAPERGRLKDISTPFTFTAWFVYGHACAAIKRGKKCLSWSRAAL